MSDDPTPTPAADPEPTPAPEPRTFTQEQVDKIIADRAIREVRTKYGDYDELKAKAAKFDELDAASKSELDKANERAQKAEQERQRALETANARLVEAAVLAEAASLKALKPEHIHRLIDTTSVTVGDDGRVTGAKEAVEAFLVANPEYVGTTRGTSADQGARAATADQISREQLKSMSHDQIIEAQKAGRLDVVMGRTPR